MYRLRLDLDRDVSKTIIGIEHFLLADALQPNTRGFQHRRSLNPDTVPNTPVIRKAYLAFTDRHADSLTYFAFYSPYNWAN